MIVETYRFGPLAHGITEPFARGDLEIYGIDHFRPSFEGWVFFNDADVDESNADPRRPSFAGTFAIFGHTDCWGATGHCHRVPSLRRFDHRLSDPLTRAFRRVIVTRALALAVAAGPEIEIAIVARSREAWPERGNKKLLDCRGLQLATFA